MSQKFISNQKDLYNYVTTEYQKYDVELNSLFFDFPVHMLMSDILTAYEILQHDINGDLVIKLKNPQIETTENGIFIWGSEMEPLGLDNDVIYTGNCKDFLESFNDKELETGICRIDEILVPENYDNQNKKGQIGGLKFDFVL